MGKIAIGIVLVTLLAITGLVLRRMMDERTQRQMGQALLDTQTEHPRLFHPKMVENLPEPAQRYVLHAIAEGTPLLKAATITMEGTLDLGTPEKAQQFAMNANQVLAYPDGFLWTVEARRDHIWMSGSDGSIDGTSLSRFWLFGLLPVVRAGGTEDHFRSALGRYAAEAVFWTPAALLPSENVTWSATGENSARVSLTHNGFEQSVDVTVDKEGRPFKVALDRWTDANPEKRFTWQRFGGYLSEFREFEGFTLPTYVEAGNFFESDDYSPFFRAQVTSIKFSE